MVATPHCEEVAYVVFPYCIRMSLDCIESMQSTDKLTYYGNTRSVTFTHWSMVPTELFEEGTYVEFPYYLRMSFECIEFSAIKCHSDFV